MAAAPQSPENGLSARTTEVAAPAAGPNRRGSSLPLLFLEEEGRLEVWAADFLQPVLVPADECDEPGKVRSVIDWHVPEASRSAFSRARPLQGDLGQVLLASSSGYDFCDCTLTGATANASTCAPDCGSDCDEGHDGTTCHVHQYYRYGPANYQTYIADYVDCCECSPYTSFDCGNTINTSNCGFCAGGCFGGYASCCVYHLDLFARHRKVTSSHTVQVRTVRLQRGTSRFASNEILVTQGGREDCDDGSRDGWRSYSFRPDKSVSSFKVGAWVSSTWSCAAPAPSLSGSGFSCSCYQAPALTCSDGYCDPYTDPDNDPDCAQCVLQDGVCFPGCEGYFPDPDCFCDDPTEIECTE